MFKDFLHKAGIIINCKTLTVEWQGKSIPMTSKSFQEASSGMCRLRVNYTLPIISDIVRKRQGYKYMTTLGLNMMFYPSELTDQAKEISMSSLMPFQGSLVSIILAEERNNDLSMQTGQFLIQMHRCS